MKDEDKPQGSAEPGPRRSFGRPIGEDRANSPADVAFVGRAAEQAAFDGWLAAAAEGAGRVVLVAGEAGIGKTALLDEMRRRARRSGAIVLSGRCERDSGHAYAAFRAALDGYVAEARAVTLREQCGDGAPVLAEIVPRLRTRLEALPEAARLSPAEEQARVLDSVGQLFGAISTRAPLVLTIDDLHWADDDTLRLLRYLARRVGGQRIVLALSYRHDEAPEEGSLAQTLALLRRFSPERIQLMGLAEPELEHLLQALAEERTSTWSAGPVDAAVSRAIGAETKGNPFFVRSLVLHLEEEGRLRVEEGRWCASTPLTELGLPSDVRPILRRRVQRLSPEAQSFLAVASFVGDLFRFDVVAAAAKLGEERALEIIDEALRAQIIDTAPGLDSYTFAHALVRQTFSESVDPAPQARLHREIAEAMERVLGERAGESAAAIALHYSLSRAIPGAARGAPYCIAAADAAIRAAAFADAATHLSAAVDLLPPDAPEQVGLLARLGLVLVGALRVDESLPVVMRAADLIAEADGAERAANYLASGVRALWVVGGASRMAALVSKGLEYAGDRRDETWATFKIFDIQAREIGAGNGIPVDSEDRREVAAVLNRAQGPIREMFYYRRLTSRAEILANEPEPERCFPVGDYRGGAALLRRTLADRAGGGRIGLAAAGWAGVFRFHVALGEFELARQARDEAVAAALRLPEPSEHAAQLIAGEDEWRLARDEDWDAPMLNLGPGMGSGGGATSTWYRIGTEASIARTLAHLGRVEKAVRRLASVLPALEAAPGWSENYTRIACDAAATLWLCEHTDSIEVVERNLRTKVIEPDFRYPMMDGRLSMARLCALRGRYDEASEWFARARAVLEEQGARPLRAIADYDEALMHHRRGDSGDTDRSRALLDAALQEFTAIGMPGWATRAQALMQRERASPPPSASAKDSSLAGSGAATRAVFRFDGDGWIVSYGAATVRLRRTRGMELLSVLLRAPDREIAATELIERSTASRRASAASGEDASARAEAPDRSSYRRRLIDLREELAEAERFNDIGQRERLQAEIDLLTRELARAVGLGEQARGAASHAERARINASRAIAAALEKIREQHPDLGEHLSRTVRTGTLCSYRPDPRAPIEWET